MRLHFLNVKNGDCSIIEHSSGNKTIIDISNGKDCNSSSAMSFESAFMGNYQQKKNPDNPICYLKNLNIKSIHRFVLTHPDMDHMDGLKTLFDNFNITNFWDTNNNKSLPIFESFYNQDDWSFYKKLKSSTKTPKRLYLTDENNHGEDDGLFILAPSKDIIKKANKTEKYNELSYVILWITNGFKIMISGDSENLAWEHIIQNYSSFVSDIDILLAPHHGRKSGRDFSFLDVLKPKYTLLGNAKSEHLEYQQYKKYGKTITNNQAGNIILEFNTNDKDLDIYVENKKYAEDNHKFQTLNSKIIAKKTYYLLDAINE